MIYTNRIDAGKRLAERLRVFLPLDTPGVVIALSRGGVVVGHEVAQVLGFPLDFLGVQHINLHEMTSLPIGAVDRDGAYVINPDTAPYVDPILFHAERLKTMRSAANEFTHLSAHDHAAPSPSLSGKVVVLVEDTILTGTSVMTSIEYVEQQSPELVVVAAPIATPAAVMRLEQEVDVVVVDTVPSFPAPLSDYFGSFLPERDETIQGILAQYHSTPRRLSAPIMHGGGSSSL